MHRNLNIYDWLNSNEKGLGDALREELNFLLGRTNKPTDDEKPIGAEIKEESTDTEHE